MQMPHTAWNTRRLAVISTGSQVHHMSQRYRRLLDWRNERGESRLPVRACLYGWTRGCENFKWFPRSNTRLGLDIDELREVWTQKRNNRRGFRPVNRSGVLRFRTEDSGELHTNYIPWLPKLESEINDRLIRDGDCLNMPSVQHPLTG